MNSRALIEWDQTHERYLPWKETDDPYKIWISEIILQQTRVAQGINYYHRFIQKFPTVSSLAVVSIEEVLKMWEGLGYYTRARNLHAAARQIMEDYGGVFPKDYEKILSLKGVGPYTAAAIASFAYGLPYAVLDGNVLRILSRHEACKKPINDQKNKSHYQRLADRYLDRKDPAGFNQAIMNLGALVCTPKSPNCQNCPVNASCKANKKGITGQFPIKTKARKKRTREFQYLVFTNPDNLVAIFQRTKKDIWQGLFEFYLFEGSSDDCAHFVQTEMPNTEITSTSKWYRQTLSHQYIHAQFWCIKVHSKQIPFTQAEPRWVPLSGLSSFAMPKIIHCYLTDKTLTLNFAAK